MNNIKSNIEKILKEKIITISQYSRLEWKNIVYYCKTDKNEYSLKVYKNINNAYIRSNVEYNMYKIFSKMEICVPQIYFYGKVSDYYILITEWINGTSLKEMVNNMGVRFNKTKIEQLLSNYEKIWNLNVDKKMIDLFNNNKFEMANNPSMLYTRTNLEEKKIFSYFNNINNIELIEKIYNKLKNDIKIEYKVINSDISAYEVIFNEKVFWIDFESFTLGNINNDIAGIFYSLSNSIIDNLYEIKYLMNIVAKNKYFNKNCFVFYLIERILSANYLSNFNEKEIKFYIKFILKLL